LEPTTPESTTPEPITHEPITHEPITHEPTTLEPSTPEHVTHPEVTTRAPTTPPNDNLVIAAEDLVRQATELLTHYHGEYRTQIEEQVQIINDLLAIANDPTNKSDKFLTAVVLGNQVKVLRDLLSRVEMF